MQETRSDPPAWATINALTVIATVVSRQPTAAIVDGGYKAFSTDRPFRPQAKDAALADVPFAWGGDEHGRLDLTKAQREVNLYDSIYGLRGDRVEAIWRIAARGMS